MKEKLAPVTTIRMPKDLRQWLKKRAGKSYRTLTAEVICVLRMVKEQEEASA